MDPVSLADVMNEQLAKQLDDENHDLNTFSESSAETDTAGDLAMARMLQTQFDRESDTRPRAEDEKNTPVRIDRRFDREESDTLPRQEERKFKDPEESDNNHDLNTHSESSAETDSDLVLAQMLQTQFDRESDTWTRAEEKKLNGNSKLSISYENYRQVRPYEDNSEREDGDEDEGDWQEEDDPYWRGPPKPPVMSRRGYIGKGKNITTKHDATISGRKNTARVDNFAPRVNVGDELDMDLKLSNTVYNSLKQHCHSEQKRGARLHEKKEHSTAEQAVDPRTRLLMFKLVSSGVLERINGCISTGKESVVFHANGGSPEGKSVPDEVVLKVFKTTLNEFKNRERYIKDDYRFKKHYSKFNPRKVIKLWAEKEMHNLTRMRKAGISCPEVVSLNTHILVMSFIGRDHVPAPKLKDAALGPNDMEAAYEQVLHMMQLLYKQCNLVHADLSEYNMLWYDHKVWLIDVSQSVEPNHPHALEFLFRDCRNVSAFFRKGGVEEAMNEYDLFNAVTGLDLTVTEGDDDQGEFISQIVALEKTNEGHVQMSARKDHRFALAESESDSESENGSALGLDDKEVDE